MSGLKRVPVIYLAGGMRSNWQQVVKAVFAQKAIPAIFIDPRDHGCKDEQAYTSWDLEGVRRADIVFGFLEKDNPNGAGLALEVGFAKALNEVGTCDVKRIIFVEENGFPHSRYFGMVRVCADINAPDLAQGIAELEKMLLLYWN